MFKKIVGLGFQSKGKNAKVIKTYIESLVNSGATEFFTGYNPTYWSDLFGFEVSPNGRFAEHEQITDFETLKQIVIEVHNYNLEIFINLNAWYYTDITFDIIKKMVGEFIEVGVDGIICGNVSILEYLKEIDYKGKINISTIMALYNTESIDFFVSNYRVNKIILSREITLKEIQTLTSNFPGVKFEVFGEGDFCRYNNGLCFAEHKYSTRDICTVVVDDLVFKKRFNPDFKKIILNKDISQLEKTISFNDNYKDIFQNIEDILDDLELETDKEKINLLKKYILQANKRIDLFYDALDKKDSNHNQNIYIVLKGVNYLLDNLSEEEKIDILEIKDFCIKNIKSGIKYNLSKIKEFQSEQKIEVLKTNIFYSKGDNLNLYSYLFFDSIKNIETVKFPTRGRNYNEKLLLIEKVLNEKEVDISLLDRSISPKRTHYDLTYLFKDKNRFKKILSNFD